MNAGKTGTVIDRLFASSTGERGRTEAHELIVLVTSVRIPASATVQARRTVALADRRLTS